MTTRGALLGGRAMREIEVAEAGERSSHRILKRREQCRDGIGTAALPLDF